MLLIDPELLVLRVDANLSLNAESNRVLEAVEHEIDRYGHEHARVLLRLFVEHLKRRAGLAWLPKCAHLNTMFTVAIKNDSIFRVAIFLNFILYLF